MEKERQVVERHKAKASYAIGYVTGDEVKAQWMDCRDTLLFRDSPSIVRAYSGPVLYIGRNLLAKHFVNELDPSIKTLLMMDTDVLFTLDDVDKLLAHDEPIVSGIYPTYNGINLEAKIVADGCGFMKIDREVFEALGPRPFDPLLVRGFDPETEEMMTRFTGEDVGFRIRARYAGYDTVIDRDIRLRHLKQVPMPVPGDMDIDVICAEIADRYNRWEIVPDPLVGQEVLDTPGALHGAK